MKKSIKLSMFLVITLCLFASCATTKETNLLQEIKKNYPAVIPEEYRIIPGDLLTIQIYTLDKQVEILFKHYTPRYGATDPSDNTSANANQVRQLEGGSYRIPPLPVYADGTINFPHIGKVYVKGFTILEIRRILTEKLEQIAENTTAEVSLFNRYFSVLGEAGNQRISMANNKITIFQALASSQLINPGGDRSRVSIIRQNGEGSIVKTFDLRSENIIDSEYYYIQANDVIYMPQAKRKFLGSPTSLAALVGVLSSVTGFVVFIFYRVL